MTSGHDIAMSLRAAYWTMHREADTFLKAHGVTANQFVLLSILAEHTGLTQQELVRLASSDANTVRAMLVLLERAGLLSRLPHPHDRRAYRVALTKKGRATHRLLKTKSRSFHKRLLAAVGPGVTHFLDQLRAIENIHSPVKE